MTSPQTPIVAQCVGYAGESSAKHKTAKLLVPEIIDLICTSLCFRDIFSLSSANAQLRYIAFRYSDGKLRRSLLSLLKRPRLLYDTTAEHGCHPVLGQSAALRFLEPEDVSLPLVHADMFVKHRHSKKLQDVLISTEGYRALTREEELRISTNVLDIDDDNVVGTDDDDMLDDMLDDLPDLVSESSIENDDNYIPFHEAPLPTIIDHPELYGIDTYRVATLKLVRAPTGRTLTRKELLSVPTIYIHSSHQDPLGTLLMSAHSANCTFLSSSLLYIPYPQSTLHNFALENSIITTSTFTRDDNFNGVAVSIRKSFRNEQDVKIGSIDKHCKHSAECPLTIRSAADGLGLLWGFGQRGELANKRELKDMYKTIMYQHSMGFTWRLGGSVDNGCEGDDSTTYGFVQQLSNMFR